MLSTQKETSQLNQTLKTEIKMYESMHCQTEGEPRAVILWGWGGVIHTAEFCDVYIEP